MKGKLSKELLYADLDISLISMTIESNLVLRITEKPKILRVMLAMLFGIPGCFLLRTALSAPLVPPYLIQFIAILCIPAMGLLTVLFGFSVFEKTFDRAQRRATNSVRVFWIKIDDSKPLSEKGLVQLTSNWALDPPGWEYRITVMDFPGYGFSISGAYQRALDFGRQVSAFLSYEFNDASAEKSRQ